MIYRRIVERQLRRAFEALNRGDHAPILAAFGTPETPSRWSNGATGSACATAVSAATRACMHCA